MGDEMKTDSFFPVSSVDPADMAMEARCVCLQPVILFLDEEYGRDKTQEVVAATHMNFDYLHDANNWVSFAYVCRLLQKLADVTGDDRSSYHVARSYTDKVSYKALAIFLTHLGSPRTMYKLIVQFRSLWGRVNTWDIEKIKEILGI